MRKLVLLFLLLIGFISKNNAQNPQEKWSFGLHAGSVLYSEVDKDAVGGAYIDQLPRITLSRYMFKGVTFQAAIGFSILDEQEYNTIDGIVKYDFGNSYDNVVPYILAGGSIVSAKVQTLTFNFGAGSTFWVNPNIGLNLQLMYKFSPDTSQSQRSHFYPTVGLVYSFKARNMNPRLWNFRH